MSDLEFLYAIFTAFYLWECTHWLPLASVPFVSWFGELSRATKPFFVVNHRAAGLVFSSPVPSFGTFFVSSELPVALSPSAVANDTGIAVPLSNQSRFAAHRQRLLVNGQRFATGISPSQVRWLAAELNAISQAPEPTRQDKVMRLLRQTMESGQVARRLAEFNRAARFSDLTAAALFLCVFVVAPTLIWRLGIALIWPGLLGGLILLCTVNAVVFFRAHKHLHPELEEERFVHVLMVLLFPPTAMRTRDMLSRPLLERFHPLASASELCDGDGFETLAGRTLRDLRYPSSTRGGSSPQALDAWEGYRRRMLRTVEGFVSRNGLSLDKLAAAPAQSEPECKTYCPRCQAQFTRAEGKCSDCGVALVRFVQNT